MQLTHAWRYFELHANQRLSLIRYYILLYTLYISGCGYFFVRSANKAVQLPDLITPISIAFICITIIFYILDNRNRQLIKLAEASLIEREKEIGFKDPHNIFTIDEQTSSKSNKLRHTDCFRALFLIAMTTALMITFLL
jgi:hypothetical protein